jgi:hypothetical protein
VVGALEIGRIKVPKQHPEVELGTGMTGFGGPL